MSHYYVLVRKDIPLRDQACQIAHACVGIVAEHPSSFVADCHEDECQNIVVLHVENLAHLEAYEMICQQEGILYFTHSEPDDGIGKAALATVPLDKPSCPAFVQNLSRLRLWKPVTTHKCPVEQVRSAA